MAGNQSFFSGKIDYLLFITSHQSEYIFYNSPSTPHSPLYTCSDLIFESSRSIFFVFNVQNIHFNYLTNTISLSDPLFTFVPHSLTHLSSDPDIGEWEASAGSVPLWDVEQPLTGRGCLKQVAELKQKNNVFRSGSPPQSTSSSDTHSLRSIVKKPQK